VRRVRPQPALGDTVGGFVRVRDTTQAVPGRARDSVPRLIRVRPDSVRRDTIRKDTIHAPLNSGGKQ